MPGLLRVRPSRRGIAATAAWLTMGLPSLPAGAAHAASAPPVSEGAAASRDEPKQVNGGDGDSRGGGDSNGGDDARRAETRTTEATADPTSAWSEPGFRMRLRCGWEQLLRFEGGISSTAFALGLEPEYRLSRELSLGLGLRYSILGGNWSGLRWNSTLDFTWHPASPMMLTLGAGYGGLMISGSYPDEQGWGTNAMSCDGSGVAALGRIGYLFVASELFATGPVVQADYQATWCHVSYADGSERHRALWAHGTLQLSWSFAWR